MFFWCLIYLMYHFKLKKFIPHIVWNIISFQTENKTIQLNELVQMLAKSVLLLKPCVQLKGT